MTTPANHSALSSLEEFIVCLREELAKLLITKTSFGRVELHADLTEAILQAQYAHLKLQNARLKQRLAEKD